VGLRLDWEGTLRVFGCLARRKVEAPEGGFGFRVFVPRGKTPPHTYWNSRARGPPIRIWLVMDLQQLPADSGNP